MAVYCYRGYRSDYFDVTMKDSNVTKLYIFQTQAFKKTVQSNTRLIVKLKKVGTQRQETLGTFFRDTEHLEFHYL